MRKLVVLFVLIACTAIPGFSQTTFGSITGAVTDPSGAFIPDASITVVNEGTGATRKATTGTSGVYNVPNLDLGTYRLTITAAGFAEFNRSGLTVSTNQIVNVNATLGLEGTASSVEVSGDAQAINTETSTLSDVKTNQHLQQLPLEMTRHLADKGIYTYAFLTTGTSSSTYSSLPVINGVRTSSGTLPTMDGIAVTAYSGGANPVQPSFESIQEVNVVTANPSAEFAVAANYTVVTKSGTNELHGTAFYTYNGNSLNARNFFNTEKPFRVYNNFGGSLGGPIVKNKLFFFGDYEGSREATKNVLITDVPLTAWRNGDFSGLDTPVIDPATGNAFPGNIIPPDRISDVSRKVQDGLYALPNFGDASLQSGNFRKQFRGVTGFTIFNMFDARADYHLSERDTFFARVSWRRMPLDGTFLTPTIGYVPQRRFGHSAIASWTHTFTPALLNEMRAGATYHRNSYHPDVIGSDLIQAWGIQGVKTVGINNAPIFRVDPVSYIDWDDDDDSYYNNPSTNYELIDNLSWTRGKHFMKFGFDVIRDQLNETAITSQVYGAYDFTGVYSGFGYADFLLGIPQTTSLAVPTPPRYLRATTFAAYVQDDFRISRNLTINYGLRWQYQGPFSHKLGAIYSFDPATGALVIPDNGVSQLNPFYPQNIPIVTASEAGYPSNSLFQSRKNEFQPRIGLAYKPFADGKTVIRAGYGIYSNLVFRPLGRDMGSGPFAGSATYINQINDGVPLFSFPEPFLSSAIGAQGTQNVQGKNPRMKAPYTQQWNFTIEHQVADIGLRASYVGTRTVNLIYARNLNQLAPSTTPFSIANRPYANYNRVVYSDNGGYENYNGLELGANKKHGQNLTFGSGWTWARDLTDTQDAGGGGSAFGGQVLANQFDRNVEKSNSALVSRQRAFAYAIYLLPVGRNQRYMSNANSWLEGFLGGWQASWNVNLQSGQYFTPSFSGFDPSNTGTFGGRPDRIADGNLPTGERTIQGWFDASAFKVPGCPDTQPVCQNPENIGRFGNAGLNILEGPGIANIDFSLMKYFHIKERAKLQFRVIMVNALNHPNFAVPRLNISQTGNVATITGMARVLNGEPATREIDLGLRLEF